MKFPEDYTARINSIDYKVSTDQINQSYIIKENGQCFAVISISECGGYYLYSYSFHANGYDGQICVSNFKTFKQFIEWVIGSI